MEWDALSPDDYQRWYDMIAQHATTSDESIGSSLPDISVDSTQFDLSISSNGSRDNINHIEGNIMEGVPIED